MKITLDEISDLKNRVESLLSRDISSECKEKLLYLNIGLLKIELFMEENDMSKVGNNE